MRGGSSRRVLLGLLGVVLLVTLWRIIIWAYALPPIVLPTPGQTALALGKLFVTPSFWHDMGVSILEFVVGYALGVALGIVVGVAMGESRLVRLAFNPVIEGLRFIVPFAWIPLTVLWFGTSLGGKVALVAYAVFFVMVVSTMRSLMRVDPTLTRVGTMLGMNRARLALKVHLRAAAPGIASAGRAAAAVGWIAVVAAEYIGASAGLGVMITNAATSLATPVVIAGMIVIGAVGAVVSAAIRVASQAWLEYT